MKSSIKTNNNSTLSIYVIALSSLTIQILDASPKSIKILGRLSVAGAGAVAAAHNRIQPRVGTIEDDFTQHNTFARNEALQALHDNNMSVFEHHLLKNKGEITREFRNNVSLLHYAAEKGNVKAVNFLLAHGVNPNVTDAFHFTPLDYAVRNNNTAVVKELLAHGADQTIFHAQHGPALMQALKNHADPQLVDALLAKIPLTSSHSGPTSEMIAARDNQGNRVLHYARRGYEARAIINRGGNPNFHNNQGDTAFHAAAKNRNTPVLAALCSFTGTDLTKFRFGNINPNLQNAAGDTALHITVNNNNSAGAQTLLNAGANPNITNSDGQTALHVAAARNNPLAITALMSAHADPNVPDRNGDTPLIVATKNNNVAAIQALARAQTTNKNAIDRSGNMPLHIATRNNNPAAVQALLDDGADVDGRNSSGETPLHVAAGLDNSQIAQQLIDNNASRWAMDAYGRFPATAALENLHADMLYRLLAP